MLKWYPVPARLFKFWHSSLFVTRTVACMYDRTPSPMQPLAFFIFAEKYRCENGWSTTPRFTSFPLRAFWSMIFWRKRPERKNEVHEFPVWNVHGAHGRSTAVGRNAPSRTQTIILQVIYCRWYCSSALGLKKIFARADHLDTLFLGYQGDLRVQICVCVRVRARACVCGRCELEGNLRSLSSRLSWRWSTASDRPHTCQRLASVFRTSALDFP